MAHRCAYGKELFRVYVGRVNSDQTEGKGPMRDHSFWTTPEDALKAVTGKGVMGVGNGDVNSITYWACETDGCQQITVMDVKVYDGYAARGGKLRGFGPDGWRPEMSPLFNDPEYKAYLRLKEKFEK